MTLKIPPNTPTTLRKIVSFLSLPKGWHYGEGSAATPVMFGRAVKIYHALMLTGFSKTDAFPGIDGEIQITGYHREHFVSITAELDGTYSLAHEANGVSCCEADRVQWLEAKAALRKVGEEEVWNTSASSTQSIGTLNVNGSATWRLKNPATAGSRWSARPAPNPLVAA